MVAVAAAAAATAEAAAVVRSRYCLSNSTDINLLTTCTMQADPAAVAAMVAEDPTTLTLQILQHLPLSLPWKVR